MSVTESIDVFAPNASDRTGAGWKPNVDGHFFHLARQARDNGYKALIPIAPYKKACFLKGWTEFRNRPPRDDEIRAWIEDEPKTGFGYCHNAMLVAFDLDIRDEAEIQRRVSWLFDNVPGEPMIRIGQPPKILIVYRASLQPKSYGHAMAPEIYYGHGQTVFFGMHPETRQPYRWQNGSPATRPWEELPECNGYHIHNFLIKFSGDPGIKFSEGMSAVKTFLKLASDNQIVLDDFSSFARVIAIADTGHRHLVLKAAMAYARNQGSDDTVITNQFREAYMALFKNDSLRDQRSRLRDFDDVFEWVKRKVPVASV